MISLHFNDGRREGRHYLSRKLRSTCDDHDHDQGRHSDLLQGLGKRTTRRLQPWLAVERGRLGRSDGVSWRPWLPRHRARSPWAWPIEPVVEWERDGHLC